MKPIHWLSLLYVFVCVGSISIFGVKYVIDSHRYIEYATNLHNGFYAEKHNFWYIGYVIFIYAITAIHDSYEAIILAQYVYGLVAVWCLYYTSRRLFCDERVAFITAILFVLFVETTTWHSYILAESFLTSSVCVTLYLLSSIHQGDRRVILYLGCAVMVMLTAFAKPTGMAIVGTIGIVLAIRFLRGSKLKAIKWTGALVGSILFVVLVNTMLKSFNVVHQYQTGEIVFASSKQPERFTQESLYISVPDDLYIPSSDNEPVVRIASFLWMNPLFTLELFFKKMFYFLFHVRPYWSIGHNIFSLIFLVPIYVLAIGGTNKSGVYSQTAIFAFFYLLIQTIAVSATSVDWDGRFLMPLLPVLFLTASKGLDKVLRTIRDKSIAN